jgi:hypothetical protein
VRADKFKSFVRRSRFYWPILKYRRFLLESSYQKRRDHYQRLLEQRGVFYDEASTIQAIRDRIRQRGYRPSAKGLGEIRTFSIVSRFAWHEALLNELAVLGPVFNCDFGPFDLTRPSVKSLDGSRKAFNDHLMDTLRREHARKPFDWIFAYVGGAQIHPRTLDRIHREVGIPTVNMCLDDKNCWSTQVVGGVDSGQVDIAGSFDVAWTSARVACNWYLAEGGRPIYMPEGCDPSEFYPRTDGFDIPVSFLGACYGCRPFVIRFLRRHGVDVKVFGSGWGRAGQFAPSAPEVFSRSQINLGIGGISTSEQLTNVKGRDIEVCCTGGGAYLTTFNPDLACAFDVGREILCYRNRQEAVELVKEYLPKPDECKEIATRARARCLREHRWAHRFLRLCRILGVATEETGELPVPSPARTVARDVQATGG